MLPVQSPTSTPPSPNKSSGGILPDAKTCRALTSFRDRLAVRYGDRLRGLVLSCSGLVHGETIERIAMRTSRYF